MKIPNVKTAGIQNITWEIQQMQYFEEHLES
jgi:hypothetical protein